MNVFTILKKIWYWSYERGSWQYDVMVFAILAFIFLIPARIFDDPAASPRRHDAFVETFVPAAQTHDSSFEALSTALGGADVHRVQAVRGSDGEIRGYRVWTRAHQ
jgi:hypothetical protein